ncbi:MAG: GNAT family N-acetyltransferase [Proteobacteria bacterium]|nr:GNAT family N-acetyltransferase [Pseudomonadota bacterium]MBU1714476.1 GNAT family N-acetyltransferase [Pseudomonadota bacterium]
MMITIRPATMADRKQLLGLVLAQDNFTEEEQEVAREVIEDSLFKRDDYQILTAVEKNGALLGFVCYGIIPMTEKSFDLYWIATAPEHGRRGIASQLLSAMETELNKSAGAVVYVDTSSTDGYERARSFYEKNGYQVAARFSNFYKTGDDRVIYRKEL